MEESGIVSIWLGSFESREALAAYAENRFMQNENGEKVPSFTQDFFNGDLWPFEPDVFDYEFNGAPSQDPAVVAAPLGEELCAALTERANALGLRWSYHYESGMARAILEGGLLQGLRPAL